MIAHGDLLIVGTGRRHSPRPQARVSTHLQTSAGGFARHRVARPTAQAHRVSYASTELRASVPHFYFDRVGFGTTGCGAGPSSPWTSAQAANGEPQGYQPNHCYASDGTSSTS